MSICVLTALGRCRQSARSSWLTRSFVCATTSTSSEGCSAKMVSDHLTPDDGLTEAGGQDEERATPVVSKSASSLEIAASDIRAAAAPASASAAS